MAECIFCRIAAKEIPSKMLYEDEQVVAFEDANPQAPVHFLVVPTRHIATVVDMASSGLGLLGHMVKAATTVARSKGLEPKGYRLVFNYGKDGGQLVQHVHMHVMGGRVMSWPPG